MFALSSLLCVALVYNLLALGFDVHGWLWSDSVLWRCRAWFLRISALLSHELVIHSLAARRHQVIMLLHQTKWVWWWTTVRSMLYSSFAKQPLCIWTCRSFLSCTWSQSWTIIVLIRTKTSLSSLILFSWTGYVFPSSQHLTVIAIERAHALKRINIESSCTNRSSLFKDAKLLLI